MSGMPKERKIQIRNSTAEFLIFSKQAGENTIEVRIEDETIWLSQKLMAILFEVSVPTINEHLSNIFKSCELRESATVRKFRIVQTEGTRQINREIDYYNLDAIIAVGFRVNSERATQFRQWAIAILRDFSIRGYVLDNNCLRKVAHGKDRSVIMGNIFGKYKQTEALTSKVDEHLKKWGFSFN